MFDYGLYLARELAFEELLESTAGIRERNFDRTVEFCGIINAKCGKCEMDCRFCSQSGHYATEVDSYPLLDSVQILEKAAEFSAAGILRCGLVTSGAKLNPTEIERLLPVIEHMQANILPCASFGRVDLNSLKLLKAAGLRRYHHNLECSQEYYAKICSTQTWLERFQTICEAKAIGLEICCGGLFGIGETWADRIDLAIAIQEIEPESVPINFYHARPGTPLADLAPLGAEEALRIVAVYRHLLPKSSIRICGGRPKILREIQTRLFEAGADALMSGDYLTTGGMSTAADREMVDSLGLELRTNR